MVHFVCMLQASWGYLVISADSPGDTAEDLEASRAVRDGAAPVGEQPPAKVVQSEDGDEAAAPPPPKVEAKGLKELGSTLVERAKDVTFLISQALEGKCVLEAEVLSAVANCNVAVRPAECSVMRWGFDSSG